MPDKYSATWLSHSSIKDFLRCPRAYYLNNVYKDPKTNHKIQLMNPPLALGQIVHAVIEQLSSLPVTDRLKISLVEKFESEWKNVTGIKGGFTSQDEEERYKTRGREMLVRVMNHPGPISQKAVKINQSLPWYWLSEPDELILCGRIDWLEYLENTDSVGIIDFKTSRNEEDSDSMQLPIYVLLATHTQTRPVSRISYWYLAKDNQPVAQTMPDLAKAQTELVAIGKRMRLMRKLNSFKCLRGQGGCSVCQPLEKIINGEGRLVGESEFHQDVYVLPDGKNQSSKIL